MKKIYMDEEDIIEQIRLRVNWRPHQMPAVGKLLRAIFGEPTVWLDAACAAAYLLSHQPGDDLEAYIIAAACWVRDHVDGELKKMAGARSDIEEAFQTLAPREARVLTLRFGLDDDAPRNDGGFTIGRTLEALGHEFSVSKERIRQVEAKALRKLRHPSCSRRLKRRLVSPSDIFDAYVEREKLWGLAWWMGVWLAWKEDETKQLAREVADKAKRIGYLEGLILKAFTKPITESGLSVRVTNLLARAQRWASDIPTVGEVALLSERELQEIRNLGYKGRKEIKDVVRSGRSHIYIEGKVSLDGGHQSTVNGVGRTLRIESRHKNEARILDYFAQHPDEVYRPPEIIEQLTSKIGWTRGPHALYQLIMGLASLNALGRLRVSPYVFYGSCQAIEDLRNRIIGRCKEVRHVEKV